MAVEKESGSPRADYILLFLSFVYLYACIFVIVHKMVWTRTAASDNRDWRSENRRGGKEVDGRATF